MTHLKINYSNNHKYGYDNSTMDIDNWLSCKWPFAIVHSWKKKNIDNLSILESCVWYYCDETLKLERKIKWNSPIQRHNGKMINTIKIEKVNRGWNMSYTLKTPKSVVIKLFITSVC